MHVAALYFYVQVLRESDVQHTVFFHVSGTGGRFKQDEIQLSIMVQK